MQRYRESHDFYHSLLNLPVSVEYEVALKLFEFTNLGLPMTLLSTFAAARLTSPKRKRLFEEYMPWALKCGSSAKSLIAVYWEEKWAMDVQELRRELGVWEAPEAKWRKPLREAKEAAEKKATTDDGQAS